ncbi:MAG TPA: Crp/Fnr family transcriptional regulator [Puia sp.]|nr:Crp/Fnr family transcriptional regulator [Puia sp.]
MDLFTQKISSKITLTKRQLDKISAAFISMEVDKGQQLIKQNAFCHHYYFLEKGLLRFVYHTKNKEATSWVVFEGIFFSEMIALKSGLRTTMSLEAIEPSIVLTIDKTALNELCVKVRPLETFLRLTWEENLYHLLQMKLLQQFSTAKERYELLIKDQRLSQRIPQKYLASILGITPYSLSRLRALHKA